MARRLLMQAAGCSTMDDDRPLDARDRIVRGRTVERLARLTCGACGAGYDVLLRAYGSAAGRSTDEGAIEAEAAAAAARNLERQTPMEACPECGTLQEDMVERLFSDPRHVAARRRHDDCRDAVNSPWARAVRLQRRGMPAAEVAGRIAAAPGPAALLPSLLGTLEVEGGRKQRMGLASTTEGQLLVELLRRRNLSPAHVARTLQELHGIDPARARNLATAPARESGRSQEALVLALAGVLVIGIGGFITFVMTVVAPFVEQALHPPEPPTPEIRLVFPMPVHYRVPKERARQGDETPVPVRMYAPDRDPALGGRIAAEERPPFAP